MHDKREQNSKSAGCDGKGKKASWRDAKKQVKNLKRRNVKAKFQIYRCNFCHGYHIGKGDKGKTIRMQPYRRSRIKSGKIEI